MRLISRADFALLKLSDCLFVSGLAIDFVSHYSARRPRNDGALYLSCSPQSFNARTSKLAVGLRIAD